jgi:hypothetical protein
MTQQIINLGTSANAGDGDNLRSAMDKTNDNFTELYGANSVSSNLAFSGQTISSYNTNGDIILGPDGTGTIRIAQNVIPDADNTRWIGSNAIRPLGLYVGTAGITTSGPVTNATYANVTVRDSTITSPQPGMIVSAANVYYGYTGSSWTLLAGADGIAAVVDDTTPQLGGNLDLNSKDITGTGAVNITGNITTTGNITGANLLTGGDVFPGGNVTMGTGNITSQSGNIVTTSGNISGGNIITGGIVIATGNVSGGNVSGATVTATNNVTLPFFADDAARDAAITSPAAGMMIFNSTGTKFQGYTGSAWVDLN